ncbi:MAG: metallophosphoesterase [Nanoarchaeota archaeon]|nr:metallophosphoesterase [Nanoarchaeota archaeon]
MKFAIITDIHLGPEGHHKGVLRKMNKDVKIYLDNFVKEMNNKIKPEFVVVLGDLIEQDNKIKDKEHINYIVQLLKKLRCTVYYVAGNKDLKNISEEELSKLFHQKSLYYAFDSGRFHFIVLFSKVSEDRTSWVEGEQKIWLQKELDTTNKKCVVFVHHGLADQDLTGNPWFEGMPENCLIANRKDIRNIISTSNKVIAVFNSHLHWDKQHIHDGVPYFSIQSLVENEADKGMASETHAVVNIVNDKVDVEVKGNHPKKILTSI